MKAKYPRSGIIRTSAGMDVSYTFHGKGGYSAMLFTSEAREALKGVEIKGVNFKDSNTRRK